MKGKTVNFILLKLFGSVMAVRNIKGIHSGKFSKCKPFYSKGNLVFVAESLKPCPNDHTMPFQFRNLTFYSALNVVTVNCKLIAKDTFKGPLALEINTKRCDMTDEVRCNVFPTFTLPNICTELENQLFGSNFVSRIVPKLQCPLAKGDYSVDNMLVDTNNLLKFIPFVAGRLITSTRLLQMQGGKKRPLLCFQGSVKLYRAASRRKS